MAIAFLLIAFVSFIALVIGMFYPGTVIRWGNNKTRKRVALYYGTGLLVFFIAFMITAPKKAEYNLVATPKKGPVPLAVSFKATSNQSLDENLE